MQLFIEEGEGGHESSHLSSISVNICCMRDIRNPSSSEGDKTPNVGYPPLTRPTEPRQQLCYKLQSTRRAQMEME